MFHSQCSHTQRRSVYQYRGPVYSVKLPGKRTSSLGSSTGPLWREMLVSRAFFYIYLTVPSTGAPLPPRSPRRAPNNRSSVSSSLLRQSLKFRGKTRPPPGSTM
jgi:hypothetical protein